VTLGTHGGWTSAVVNRGRHRASPWVPSGPEGWATSKAGALMNWLQTGLAGAVRQRSQGVSRIALAAKVDFPQSLPTPSSSRPAVGPPMMQVVSTREGPAASDWCSRWCRLRSRGGPFGRTLRLATPQTWRRRYARNRAVWAHGDRRR